MRMTTIFFCLAIVPATAATDTLFTHPVYPPIVYHGDEYNFYKYTPKYIPEDMLHCFKILGTTDETALQRFVKRSTDEVIERGLFEDAYRIRKEFCLEGFSPFTRFFHRRGIYSPYAMQTYILLCWHQYLKQECIDWHRNKRLSLEDIRHDNRNWKSRCRKVLNPAKVKACETGGQVQRNPSTEMDEMEELFFNGDGID